MKITDDSLLGLDKKKRALKFALKESESLKLGSSFIDV